MRCFQLMVAACAMLLASICDTFLRRLTLLQVGRTANSSVDCEQSTSCQLATSHIMHAAGNTQTSLWATPAYQTRQPYSPGHLPHVYSQVFFVSNGPCGHR